MRKKILSLLMAMVFVIGSITGCGTSDTKDADKGNAGNNAGVSASSEDASGKADGKNNKLPEKLPETKVATLPPRKDVTVTADKPYQGVNRNVDILGLKEYKELKTPGKLKDTAKKGKKYLVLFLKITNCMQTEDYINAARIEAKIDGKKLEHTFLVNDPMGYKSIFTHIPEGESIKGFIVWEVPAKWKKLEMNYTGWEGIDGDSLHAKLTRKDLKDPEKLEEE